MSILDDLPEEIARHFPDGLPGPTQIWLVLPRTSDACGWPGGAEGVNDWIRTLEAYPDALANVIWYGDNGIGDLLGWDPETGEALLWNPEDDAPQMRCSVAELWRRIVSLYDADQS